MLPIHYSGPEPLELRIAPSGGMVTVTLTNGALFLTGDDGGNSLAVSAEGFAFIHLAASGGTQLLYNSVPTTELDLPQPTALTFQGGAGDDAVSLEGVGKLKTLDVEGNGGKDSLTLTTLVVSGATTVKEGDGTGTIIFNGDSLFHGKTTITATGAGNKTVNFGNNLKFDDNLTVTTGAGDDTIPMLTNTLIAAKNVTIDGGAGANAITLGNALLLGMMQVGGNLSVVQGDHPTGTSSTTLVEGEATIKGALALTEGAGTNTVSLGTAAYLRVGSIRATGGSGANTFAFGSPTLLGSLTVSGNLNFDGSQGGLLATIGVPNVSLGSLTLTGSGSGTVFSAATNSFHVTKTLSATMGNALGNAFGIVTNELSIGGAVNLTGGAGADAFYLNGGDLSFGSSLTMDAKDGANALSMAAVNVTVSGAANFDSGNHATGMAGLNMAATNFTFKKNLSIQFGDGNNDLTLISNTMLKVGGDFKMSTGTGTDDISFLGQGLTTPGNVIFGAGNGTNEMRLGITASVIGKNLMISGGSGSDLVVLAGLSVIKGSLDIDTGAGDSDVTVTGQTYGFLANKGVTVKDNAAAGQKDLLKISNLTATGLVHLMSGAADSTVSLDSMYLGKGLTIETRDGADTVNIEQGGLQGPSLIAGITSISLGAGSDAVNIGKGLPDDTVFFYNNLIVDGGDGTDKANDGIIPIIAANHFMNGATSTENNIP